MPSLVEEDLASPGTHALVIGVSAYLHFEDGSEPTEDGKSFEMEQLSCAARSASEFAAWLLNDYYNEAKPLKSLRVLLSPLDDEIHPAVSEKLRGDYSATLLNVRTELAGFRSACDSHMDNVAIVYVAGHGVQLSKHGAIVLLHDCGDANHLTRLEGAIDVAGVHAGMNHPNTAQTQFWFVDACRQRPVIARKFETMNGGLTLDTRPGDAEASPLFLAATTDKPAYARTGGLTLFFEALDWALSGGCAVGPRREGDTGWHVSVSELIKLLPDRVKALANAEGAEQSVDIAGKVHEAMLHRFVTTPKVDLQIELHPEGAKDVSKGTLAQNAQKVIFENFVHWPMQERVDAGLYLLQIETEDPYKNESQILNISPPESKNEINLSI